jgi:hypothetical protein
MKSQSLNCHGADRIRMRLITVSIALQVLLCPFACVCAGGKELPELTRPLDKVEALNLALANNGTIRQARKDVEAAAGVAIQTRAILFPSLTAGAAYAVRSLARAIFIRGTDSDLEHSSPNTRE